MSSLRRVAELNNVGVSMLVAARDKDAFKILQTALAIMEQEMMNGPDENATNSTTSNTSTSRRSSASSSSSSSANTEALVEPVTSSGNIDLTSSAAARFHFDTKCSTAIPELKDDRYFIFNQALLVETRDNCISDTESTTRGQCQEHGPEDPTPYCQSLVCFYTSVVIYNLALAYHKRGMAAAAALCSSSSHSTTMSSASNTPCTESHAANWCNSSIDYSGVALSQSLRLYEHSLKIIRSIANYSEDCKMLLYAVSCNLAHLYCRKGERSRAQELLDGLEEANRLSYQNLLD